MIQQLLKQLIRKKHAVNFNDLERTEPVSSIFGLDRGMPIDRYYIEKFLSARASLIKGRVLEVGNDSYSRKFGTFKSIDVLNTTSDNKVTTIVGDLTDKASLPENSFDCFICTQTFNFIYDVQKAVEGAHHLLKPGGILLATMGGISQISRYDMERWGDYWRFTTASAAKLIGSRFTGQVEIESYGNQMAACAFLQGVAVEDLPNRQLIDITDPDYQLLITVVAWK